MMNDPTSDVPEDRDSHSPIAIRRDGSGAILIDWSDGTTVRWTAAELRRDCPCATCREKRKADDARTAASPWTLPVLKAAEARPLEIEAMRPVGSYAYNVAFSDGHSSGIYTFAMLRRTSQPRDDHQ